MIPTHEWDLLVISLVLLSKLLQSSSASAHFDKKLASFFSADEKTIWPSLLERALGNLAWAGGRRELKRAQRTVAEWEAEKRKQAQAAIFF